LTPHIKQTIIPKRIYYIKDKQISETPLIGKDLDYEAIAVWIACGFFWGNKTFFKDVNILQSGEGFSNGEIIKSNWNWHYSPRDISFSDAVSEFADLIDLIVKKRFNNRKVILPLSGGIDSRTLAIALRKNNIDVESFSYYFDGGHNESYYGELIANLVGFPHSSFKVEKGYLWKDLNRISKINGCYSEFTHPRQAAFLDCYKNLGNVFCLGHWGDVLFDNLGLDKNIVFDEEIQYIKKIIIKKGGYQLADELWEVWGLDGCFDDYINNQLESYLSLIKITGSPNSRLRAFKSLHWAPRWNLVNIEYFRYVHSVEMPYYDDKLCKFICSIPEEYLSSRKIQIEYIKRCSPTLARKTWQEHRPFNLFNYQFDRFPLNLPYRFYDKIRRILKYKKHISMNWELQFSGKDNDHYLYEKLLSNNEIEDMVPKTTIKKFYNLFSNNDSSIYAHPVSMLLTLSQFQKFYIKSNENRTSNEK